MSQRVRILLYHPGATVPTANVWADYAAGPAPAFTLKHDYGPDLAPAPGWEIDAGRVGRFEVRTAAGRVLSCVPVPGEHS